MKLYILRTVPLSIIRSLFTVHQDGTSILVLLESCLQTCMHIPLLSVQWINSWWWTDELSESCRVSWQNKFVKLVHLVGFIIKKLVSKFVCLRLRWSRGKRAGLWYPSSRVQTRPKSSDFSGEKILSTPSFGGEVKPSVPCRKFTACKRTQKWRGSRYFRQNSRQFLAYSSTFRCWGSLVSFQTLRSPGGESRNILITDLPVWGFDVPLATALCKNLPAENSQRLFSMP